MRAVGVMVHGGPEVLQDFFHIFNERGFSEEPVKGEDPWENLPAGFPGLPLRCGITRTEICGDQGSDITAELIKIPRGHKVVP